MYEQFIDMLYDSEKCHICILALETKKQVSMTYMAHAVHDFTSSWSTLHYWRMFIIIFKISLYNSASSPLRTFPEASDPLMTIDIDLK